MTRLGRDVLDLEHATISRGGRALIDSATWRLGPGDRVGLVGVNGTGKTSLLSVLAGESPPDRGRLKVGRTVDLAYLSQTLDEQDADERVLASVESIRRVVSIGAGRETSASSMLERFGFTGDKLTARIRDLSGGERRRLQLLRLLLREPNVLLLDEPTNDLDIETLTVVEDFLDRWPGTLIVVSHDRYFLERVCDTTWALLGDGSLAMLPGGVDEYLGRRAAVPPALRDTPPSTTGETAERTSSPAARRAARKDVARLDRQLAKVNARIAALHEQMAAHASDFSRLAALDAELSDASANRDRLELEWLEAAELTET